MGESPGDRTDDARVTDGDGSSGRHGDEREHSARSEATPRADDDGLRTADRDGVRADGGETGDAYDPPDPYGQGGDPYDPAGPPGEPTSAPDDEEMPLADHIQEMIYRLGWVVLVMLVVGGGAFVFADRMINFLWYSFLPGTFEQCPTRADPDVACAFVYHPLALMFARIKVAGLVGFIAALPVAVYQSYLFMRPGLYPRERRYYLASVPTSLVLAGVGVAFAHLLVLPALFFYFTGYSEQAAEIAFGLTETFNLIVMMLGFFALIFQIPLFIMLAVMMGVTSRRWLASRRIYFWGAFATIAFIFSPDPTGMAPILVAVTMIVLFEGTLLLMYWTSEASSFATPRSLRARRPFAWLGAALAGYLVSTAPMPEGYYGQMPAGVRESLVDAGLAQSTPLIVGGALILLYEGALFLYRRLRIPGGGYRLVARARPLVWPVALLVGYFGSPDPVLLRRVEAVDLAPVEAGGLAVGLIVAYELVIIVQQWRHGRA